MTQCVNLDVSRNFKKKPHMIEWSIFLNSEKLNIYQRFEGEIRFGPKYLQLKTEPSIQEFYGKNFGDWFYKTSDGIFLQEWNSLQNANSNLIYIDFKELKFITLQKNIESVFWNMSEDNKYYNLNINTNFIEIRINKDVINKKYTTNDL